MHSYTCMQARTYIPSDRGPMSCLGPPRANTNDADKQLQPVSNNRAFNIYIYMLRPDYVSYS